MDSVFINLLIKTGIDIGPIIVNIIMFLFIKIGMSFSKKEEKDVIDFLKSL